MPSTSSSNSIAKTNSSGPTSGEQNNNQTDQSFSVQKRPVVETPPAANVSGGDTDGAAATRRPSVQSGQSSLTSSQSGSSSDGEQQRLLSSNADYDHIRNTTLMFFLDRLFIASKDGKEARTLHDLSCLFGTREFTKEMRQIVGASRNGLRKFLESYPSLFTIEDDKVYLTQLKQDANNPAVRDYNKEAVDYFTQKLLQFGASLVPIRNLFGYRSQASQEVRHVSGKSTREFKQFLSAHDDVFEILADEHVVLKSAFQEPGSDGGESRLSSLQQAITTAMPASGDEPVMDPYLNKQFAHLIEDCMKRMMMSAAAAAEEEAVAAAAATDNNNKQQQQDGTSKHHQTTTPPPHRVTIQFLHEKILQDCNNQLFLKMVKTIEDLRVFLRMHPKIFKRFSEAAADEDDAGGGGVGGDDDRKRAPREYVSLLSDEERREMELHAYHSLSSRQRSSLKRCETNESQISDADSNGSGSTGVHQPISLPPNLNASAAANNRQQQAPASRATTVGRAQAPANKSVKKSDFAIDHHSHHSNAADTRSISSTTSSHNNNNNNGTALRATAPPFVPATYGGGGQQPKSLGSHHTGRGSITSGNGGGGFQRSVSNLGQQQQQPAQRAAVIDPRQALRSYLIKASEGNMGNSLYSPSKQSNGAQFLKQQQPLVVQNAGSRQNLISSGADDLRARTVSIVREASNIITRIMTSADAVAFDCKGYNLGFNGQITLIQFAFLPGSATSGQHQHHENNENQKSQQKPAGGSVKQKPEVCIFDLITNPELAYCLKPLLESEQIIKIVHDVRNKSNALHVQFGIMLNHVFDTQVANLVIQQQETGKPAYKSRYISMSKLCEIYGNESLIKYRNLIKSKTRLSGGQQSSSSASNSSGNSNKLKDVNYWRTRPLTDAMVYESTMDVYCLLGGIYQNLRSMIKPEYKPLFEQLNLEGVLARIEPDKIRSVKKERKIDLEVIDLKRKLYSDATSSIVLSNREIRLLRHIDLTDEVRRKIQQCKKVAKKLERLDMKAAQNAELLQQQSIEGYGADDSITSATGGGQSLGDQNASSLVQTTNGSGSSSSSSTSANSSLASSHDLNSRNGMQTSDPATTNDQQQETNKSASKEQQLIVCEVSGMSNLMDSSMFDELKDRMIESSSLLESLEDDDDDIAPPHSHHQHHHHHHNHHHEHSATGHDGCGCRCHNNKQSNSIDGGDKTNLSSLKSNVSSNTADKEDASIESKAVDMAIQCDLLS